MSHIDWRCYPSVNFQSFFALFFTEIKSCRVAFEDNTEDVDPQLITKTGRSIKSYNITELLFSRCTLRYITRLTCTSFRLGLILDFIELPWMDLDKIWSSLFRTQDSADIKTGTIRNPRQNSQLIHDPRSTEFSKSANLLDLLQKSTIRALFNFKSVDTKTYSHPS